MRDAVLSRTLGAFDASRMLALATSHVIFAIGAAVRDLSVAVAHFAHPGLNSLAGTLRCTASAPGYRGAASLDGRFSILFVIILKGLLFGFEVILVMILWITSADNQCAVVIYRIDTFGRGREEVGGWTAELHILNFGPRSTVDAFWEGPSRW